jgi:hypothetical protein
MIESFLADYPHDGLVPTARVALALVALQTGDFATAGTELEATSRLPEGSAHDLWTTARARALRLQGDAEGALSLLAPLVGKPVDPVVRLVFEEELTLAALGTGRDYEAISYMDAWLRATPEDDRARVLARVTEIVEHLEVDVLAGALKVMRAERSGLGYGVDIERILSDRLVREATTSGNAELALMLLDPDAGPVPISGEMGAALGQVATSRRGLNVVEGRTIGLLLPTTPALRDASADVLRGVTWALGLPAGVRSTRAPADAPKGPSLAPCGSLASAPDGPEPQPSDEVRLVTRSDSGDTESTEIALGELAGAGAAIVIAGLDGPSADRAARWAEEKRVPVILLSSTPLAGGAAFSFSIGGSRSDVLRALVGAAPSLTTTAVTPVVEPSEEGEPAIEVAGLHWALARVCGASTGSPDDAGLAARPADSRSHAWLVSGAGSCAADLAIELGRDRSQGTIALTLEAARLLPPIAGLRVVTARAGIVPVAGADDPRAGEVARFSVALGSLTWWAALARDAATLGRSAVLDMSNDRATTPQAVAERRRLARDRLAAARARLWSTEAAGWSGAHTIERTVCALDATLDSR